MTAYIAGPITKRLNTYQYAFADAQAEKKNISTLNMAAWWKKS